MQLSVLVFLLSFSLHSQVIVYSQSLRVPASISLSQTAEDDAYLQLGEQLFAAGEWAKAENHFSDAVARQPGNPLWLVCLAVALDRQGKSKEAHAKVKQLVAIGKIESLLVFTEKSKNEKIVFVDTRAFVDEKLGITRYVAAQRMLTNEFMHRHDALAIIQRRIKAIEDDIAKSTSTQDAKATQTKQEELRKLRREFEQERKDAESAYYKRATEILGPISSDIGKALDAYAKPRNIAFVLDSRVFPNVRFLADKSVNVTQDFVTTYNSLNPK